MRIFPLKYLLLLSLVCGCDTTGGDLSATGNDAAAQPEDATAQQVHLHFQIATVVGGQPDWTHPTFGGSRHEISCDLFVPVAIRPGACAASVHKDGYVLNTSWSGVKVTGVTVSGRPTDPGVELDGFTWEIENELVVHNDSIRYGKHPTKKAWFGPEFNSPQSAPAAKTRRSACEHVSWSNHRRLQRWFYGCR